MANLTEAVGAISRQTKSEIEDPLFAGPQVLHQKTESFLSFGVVTDRLALVVGHRLGELEVAVVIKDGIERHRGARGGLEMGQVFQAAAGARGELLRAWQVLAAVRQGFGLLLEQTEFLQV